MLIVSVMVVASAGVAKAESILFPYIANTTGALDTIITVITANDRQPQLHYRYFTKAAGVANEAINPCNEHDFFRPTTYNDIVTFAVGGTPGLGGGNAMFNDPTNYNAGAGAPNFGHIHGSGRFGLLLVTTANANADVSVSYGNAILALDGEASLYDIATGAMWGYRALPSNGDGPLGPATLNSYSFATPPGFGMTKVPLTENNLFVTWVPKLGIYPPNQFTGRLFVTPLMNTTGVAAVPADADMKNHPNLKSTRVALLDANGNSGMYDRDEQPVSSGGPIDVRCVGRINVPDLLGGAIGPLAPTGSLYTVGGWAYLDLQDPGAIAVAPALAAGLAATDHTAVVMDLKFGNVSGMSGMVNDGKVMQDWFWR